MSLAGLRFCLPRRLLLFNESTACQQALSLSLLRIWRHALMRLLKV